MPKASEAQEPLGNKDLNRSTKPVATEFYREALQYLNESQIPFLMGGAFTLYNYTGVYRDTKDLDIFCKPSDYPGIMKFFARKGYVTELTDVRWLAKIFKGEYFIDLIFNTVNNICTVDDTWFENSTEGELHGVPVRFMGPEELLWCKIYVQNRERYDGADINHLILKQGKNMDWKRVLFHLEPHWHLLLGQVLNFQFVYPAERELIPRWLFDELISRANEQYDLPIPVEKVCRGPMIDQTQYSID